MILIENGLDIAVFKGNSVELRIPFELEDFLKQFFFVEFVSAYRKPFEDGFVYLDVTMCPADITELKSALLCAMFMTDLVNLN